MKTTAISCLVLLAGLSLVVADPVRAVGFTDTFRLEDCSWKSKGRQNTYYPLVPGTQSVLEGEEEDDDGEVLEIRVEQTILRETERISFTTPGGFPVSLRARVVEEREFEDGEVVEISRNFVAVCKETGDIIYFGEDVEDFEDGEVVGNEGAWRAGVDGAQPGILFPGRFLLGAKYMQEIAPGVALDRARNVAMNLEVATDAGAFSDCVGVLDSNALEPDAEGNPKVYCPGVGLVMDEDISLVEVN